MDLKTRYLEQIRILAPDLFYQNAILNDSGQFNDVLVLDDDWIFRFPRYQEGMQNLLYETRLLQALRGRLPLPIPEPVYQRFDPPEPGQALAGYRMLPGKPLFPKELKKIRDPEARERLADQLAGFLRQLHAIPPDTLGIELPLADSVEQWSRMYEAVRANLFPAMRADARGLVTRHFESYLNNPRLQSFSPCLRHGDFGGSNILYSLRRGGAALRDSTTITGVIDFSFCALGDPAADLASVSTLGASFFDLLIQRYEPDEVSREPLLARVGFYRGTFALSEALDGFKNHDARAYESGMEQYI